MILQDKEFSSSMTWIRVGLMAIIAATAWVPKSLAQNPSPIPSPTSLSSDLLSLYQDQLRVPQRLYRQLQAWNSLPAYAGQSAAVRADWLSSLHSAITGKDWPRELREAAAGTVEGATDFGFSVPGESAKIVAIPIATPVFVRALVEIINSVLVPPKSSDPDAKMMLDRTRLDQAAIELARFIGMVGEVGYFDETNSSWGGGVVMATRFIYYHELGHLALASNANRQKPTWLLPEEADVADEILADQFAFGMILLELRHHPEFKAVGFSGIIFALSLVAAKEFADVQPDGKRRIKNAYLRMSRLLWWGQRSVELRMLTSEDLRVGEFYWQTFRQLLSRIDNVPLPIFSLLKQTADRPEEDWVVARNNIVRWCAFGDRQKVLLTMRKIRDSAKAQADKEPRARKVLDVIAFLRKETEALEPELGLKKSLE